MRIEEIKNLIKEMCDLTRKGKYVPILEADLSALLFHLIITRRKAELRRVHLDTRVIGVRNNNKRFDIVIGDVHQRQDNRPAVSPKVIIEIKMFSIGFTEYQYGPHFRGILKKDLPKLGSLKRKTATRIEFIFDEVDYLGRDWNGQTREDAIVAERNKVDRGINIVFARKITGNWHVTVK